MANEAAFIWRTNIDEVAGQISRGLAKIRTDIQKAVASGGRGNQFDLGLDAGFDKNFAAGIEARMRAITTTMKREMLQASREVETELRKAGGLQGGTVQGRIAGGVADGPIGQARRSLERLFAQVNQAIPPELEGQRPQIQAALEKGAAQVQLEAQKLYANIAEDLKRLRAQLGIAGSDLRIQGSLQGATTDSLNDALRRAARGGPAATDELSREVAQREVLRSSPDLDDDSAAQLSRVVRDNTRANNQAKEAAERLAAALERQTSRRGGKQDPEGVIKRGSLVQERPGGPLLSLRDGGAYPYMPENPVDLAAQRIAFGVERKNMRIQEGQLEDQVREQQLTTEAMQRRRAAAVSLTQQIEKNRDAYGQTRNIGGATAVGNFARDDAGRLFQFTDQGRGAVELEAGTKQRLAAQQRLLAEDRRLLAAKERERRAAEQAALAAQRGAVQRPGLQGVFDRAFGGAGTGQGAGFGGRGLNFDDILTTGFSFTRYIISAAALGAAFTVLNEIKVATLDYADSLTDLQVALDDTESDLRPFTNALEDVSRLAGENPGAALDVAARGVRAFTDATATLAEQEDVGTRFAESVGQLSVIAGKSLSDSAGDIIAVSSAFETSTQRVVDAVAAAKTVGGDPSEIAQGLSSIAQAGSSAGFELEELASIISVVQARTDQTGRAAATRLARAFNVAGGSGRNALAQLNQQLSPELQVDINAPTVELIRELSELLPSLSDSQRTQIVAQVGGVANSREFLALLENYDDILTATDESFNKAGEGAAEFQRQTENLRGEVRQIAGALQSIVVQLSEAQVFAAFGLLVETLEPVLTVTVRLLEAWNSFPLVVRGIAAAVIQLGGAYKVLTLYKNATAQATAAEAAAENALAAARTRSAAAYYGGSVIFPEGTFGRAGGPIARNPNTLGRTALNFGAAGASGLSLRGGGVAGVGPVLYSSLRTGVSQAFTRLGNFLTSGTGLALIGIGGLVSAIQSYVATQNIIDAQDEAREVLGRRVSPGNVRDRINAQEAAALNLRQSSSGLFGSVSNFLQGSPVERLADGLEQQVENYRAAADAFGEAQRAAARDPNADQLIEVTTPEAIADGLKLMEDAGRTSLQQLRALQDSFNALGEAAEQSSDQLTDLQTLEFGLFFGPELDRNLEQIENEYRDFAGFFANTFSQKLFDFIPALDGLEGFGDQESFNLAQLLDNRNIDQDRIKTIVDDFIESIGGDFDREDEVTLVNLLMQYLEDQIPELADAAEEDYNNVRGGIALTVRTVRSNLQQVVDSYASLAAYVSNSVRLIGEASQELALQVSVFGSLNGEIVSGNLAGPRFELEELLRTRDEAQQRASDNNLPPWAGSALEEQQEALNDLDVQINQAILDYSRAMRDELEAQLEFDNSTLPQSDEVGQLDREIELIRGLLGDFDPLTGRAVVTDAGERRELQQQLNELERQRNQATLERAQSARRAGIPVADDLAQARADLQDAQELFDVIAAEEQNLDEKSREYYDAQIAVAEAQQRIVDIQTSGAKSRASGADDAARRRLELLKAQVEAGVDPRSGIEEATAAVKVAELELSFAESGTAEYYQAVASLNRAQIEYADAVTDAASVARRLEIDLTDQLAVAREELLTAQQRLQTAIAQDAPEDVLNQLRLEERQAQTNVESEAFSQRLSDIETARELGRITHQQYMQYLFEERERLQMVADRTRQQQDQLDQINKAIKAARDAMQGQFNLGNIDIPTPYEARRAVQEQLAGTVATTSITDARVINIEINGGDLEKVRAELQRALGSPLTISPTLTGVRI